MKITKMTNKPRVAALTVLPVLLGNGALLAEDPPTRIRLTDVTAQTGITFRHTDGSSGRRFLMETVSAGLALFDYDGDGDVDIYFLNGSPLPGATVEKPPQNALYRNDGNWKFTEVTRAAGVGDRGYGLGVAVGDYDKDGDPDIYLNNHGPNVLYRNNGDGTFADVTKEAGVGNGDMVGAGTCFLDMEGDGDLDLYVANYFKYSAERHASLQAINKEAYVTPRSYPPLGDTLYRNNGDGTFTDVSVESGVGAPHRGWGMGMVCADYDNDGDTDIFIANDICENYLFQNDGKGKFEEVGLISGVAYNHSGLEQGSMGVDCGDYNNDGLLDFYLTTYHTQQTALYKNLGDGLFEDATIVTGAGVDTLALVTWGTGFVDFDNDGDRDIFVAAGHLQDGIQGSNDSMTYHQKNLVMMNTGDGKFVNVSGQCGDGLQVQISSRGAAFDDLDNDGDIDAVILNSRREPTVLRNDTEGDQHWIQIQLRGTRSAGGGVGARVRVKAGDLTQISEVHSGRSYQSHFGTRLHFGLGERKRIDLIEIRWPGGGRETLRDVPVDRILTITEGKAGETRLR